MEGPKCKKKCEKNLKMQRPNMFTKAKISFAKIEGESSKTDGRRREEEEEEKRGEEGKRKRSSRKIQRYGF